MPRGPKMAPAIETAAMKQPNAVEPGEVALILLRNALRLLEPTDVPAQIRALLEEAILELEELLAARGD